MCVCILYYLQFMAIIRFIYIYIYIIVNLKQCFNQKSTLVNFTFCVTLNILCLNKEYENINVI